MSEEKLQILKMVEAGQIDAEEAAMLLDALREQGPEVEEAVPSPGPEPEVLPPPAASTPGETFAQEARESRWARFWIYPMMAGGVALILGLLVIGLVYTTDGARGWLVCGWLPLILGLTVVLLALWSRQAAWLHLRISEEGKRKMGFSFPLPLTLAAWVVRIAQPFVPQLRETAVDDVIMALRESAAHGEPLFIDVDDEEDGERVEIYIG